MSVVGASGTGEPGCANGFAAPSCNGPQDRPPSADERADQGRRRAVDRSNKEKLVAALNASVSDTVCFVITHQAGLTVSEVTGLRRQMRDAGASFKVTKNRLARLALHGTKFEQLSPMFTGPTAIAYSRDPVAAARIAVEFASKNEKRTIAGGAPGSQQLDAAEGQILC